MTPVSHQLRLAQGSIGGTPVPSTLTPQSYYSKYFHASQSPCRMGGEPVADANAVGASHD